MTDQRHSPFRVVFEGIDGVGKSTIIARTQENLEQQYRVLLDTLAPITLDLFKRYGKSIDGNPQTYWNRVTRRTKTQCFLTEGVVRAKYLQQGYDCYDVVLYDRWWQTFKSYSESACEFDTRCDFLTCNLPSIVGMTSI